jgi:hypothetical protein
MFHIFLLSCLTLGLQTSSFLFGFHKVISCYYSFICLGFKTYQIYLRYINLSMWFPSCSFHFMSLIEGRRGSVLFCNKHTTHTTVRTSDEHIVYRTEHTTHTENRSLVTIRALLSRLCRLTHILLCSMSCFSDKIYYR